MTTNDLDRLSLSKILTDMGRTYRLMDMITVYMSDVDDRHNRGIHCALIPDDNVDYVLSEQSWDFHYEDGLPRSIVRYDDEGESSEYLRFGDNKGIEPLIINRNFYGIRPDYEEICEEFRLFHRVYHDTKTNKFTKIFENGNEDVVAVIEPNCVKVRVQEIRQFLAVRNLYLSLQFDYKEYSNLSLKEIGVSNRIRKQKEEKKLISWCHSYGEMQAPRFRSFGHLIGKRLISPLPKSRSGFWGFEEKTMEYANFIIESNDHGDIEFTANPDLLGNDFGANPDAPKYLTPVYFRKEVLDKYYQNPGKYSVEDSLLRCGTLWTLIMDNNHEDKVCAWLGDLGHSLPYEEQLYWRSYNVQPQGELSENFFKNQILAQFSDSDRPESLFRKNYEKLKSDSERRLGWSLLLPLEPEDSHHLLSLRVPASRERREFDELVLSMAKILVDSLNKSELMKLIPEKDRGHGGGSVGILEVFCKYSNVEEFDHHISYLRRLQGLRSSSSAHRKGKKYSRIARQFDLEGRDSRVVFTDILREGTQVLDFFIDLVNSGRMDANGEHSVELSSKEESVFAETLPENVFGSVVWGGPPRSLEDMESGVLEEAKRRDEGA